MPGGGEFLFYQSGDGSIRLQVRLEAESVWLTQAQLSELFQRERSAITKHIRNIFGGGRTGGASSMCKFEAAVKELKKLPAPKNNPSSESRRSELAHASASGWVITPPWA